MNTAIKAAVKRTRTVLLCLVIILITGLYSFITIPKEAAPDVSIPIIYVSMIHRGISPEDSERMLVRPMEQEVRSIEGLKQLRATAFEGGANLILEFDAGFDSDKALNNVRAKVDIAKSKLPNGTEEPTVNEVNISLFPILVVTLSGPVAERSLLNTARQLKDKIEGLPAVLEVNIGGNREEQVDVIIDPVKIESYNLVASDVISFLKRSNKLVAAGTIDVGKGRFSIKVPGLIESIQEIMALPIKTQGDSVVSLSDIANIRKTFKDADSFARVNGQPAVTLEVSKRLGENIIETTARVKELVSQEKAFWPDNIKASFSQDQSTHISSMLSDLQNNVIVAVILVMIVVISVLGGRSGLLVGIAIPGSFLMGILALSVLGYSMNMIVLFALILSTGMLVDGAIIVVEFADRKMGEGLDRRSAYIEAAQYMAWPVIASTATTLAAFLPLIFWSGVVGEFMKYLPITLLMTLSASLLMALIFVPTLGALIGRSSTHNTAVLTTLSVSERGDVTSLSGWTGRYARLLDAALKHPAKIIVGTFVLLVFSQILYAVLGKGVEFFPDVEPRQAQILVHARGNMSTAERDILVRQVEDKVLKYSDEFKTIYARAGNVSGKDLAEDIIGSISLEFKDWQDRRPATEVLQDIRNSLKNLYGIKVEIRKKESGPPVGRPLSLQLSSRNPSLLTPAISHIRQGMVELGGYIDVEDNRQIPAIEWTIKVDRAQAAKFGVDISALGDVVKLATKGLKITDYRPNDADDEVDIVVRYPVNQRTVSQLGQLRVTTTRGNIPIANFVTITPRQRVGVLHRSDSQRIMSIKSDVEEGLLVDDQVKRLQQWLTDNPLPKNVYTSFKGEDEEQKKSQKFLGRAFLVAIFIMALILVTQFNSFYFAAVILSAVVTSTIGVMLGLLITGQPFGIVMCGIGIVALAGIVVNNNIVLIDTYQSLRKTSATAREAIIRTGAQRLRPVMLTTVTTILGLLPMALMVNINFISRQISYGGPSMQWWVQLSTSILFGLGFATILTLIVTPCALMLRENSYGLPNWFRCKLRKRHNSN